MNYTHTALTEESQLLTAGDVLGLERGVPRIRWNAAINQQVARVGVLARLNYYGAWVDHFDARFVRGADAPLLDGRYIVDLEASIPLTPDVTLAVGGQNVFRRLLAADGPVRRHLRPPLQPVHAVGPERRVLLRTDELHLGSVVAIGH